MFEEPIRFFVDLVRDDRSVLDMLDGRHTFVNAVSRSTTACPRKGSADNGCASTTPTTAAAGCCRWRCFSRRTLRLAHESREARYWVVRRVLGETIPPPPAGARAAARRSSHGVDAARGAGAAPLDPACSSCHSRFDSFGCVRRLWADWRTPRTKDLGGHRRHAGNFPAATRASASTSAAFLHPGRSRRLSTIFAEVRVRLGAFVQLSDEPLIESMNTGLRASGYRFSASSKPLSRARSSARSEPTVQKGDERHETLPSDFSSRRRRHDGAAVAGVAARVRGYAVGFGSFPSGSPSSSWATASTATIGGPRAPAPT